MLSHLQQSLVPLQFLLPDVDITTDAMPHSWAFYFQGSGVAISCCGIWSISMYKVYIELQELHVVALLLCKMAFWLPSKVVALHLDSGTAKAYLCNQGGTASLFLSRVACHVLNLAYNGITLIPAYNLTHLNVKADHFLLGAGWFPSCTCFLTQLGLHFIF